MGVAMLFCAVKSIKHDERTAACYESCREESEGVPGLAQATAHRNGPWPKCQGPGSQWGLFMITQLRGPMSVKGMELRARSQLGARPRLK